MPRSPVASVAGQLPAGVRRRTRWVVVVVGGWNQPAFWQALGYARMESPFGSEAPSAERTIEYDEGTVRHVIDDM